MFPTPNSSGQDRDHRSDDCRLGRCHRVLTQSLRWAPVRQEWHGVLLVDTGMRGVNRMLRLATAGTVLEQVQLNRPRFCQRRSNPQSLDFQPRCVRPFPAKTLQGYSPIVVKLDSLSLEPHPLDGGRPAPGRQADPALVIDHPVPWEILWSMAHRTSDPLGGHTLIARRICPQGWGDHRSYLPVGCHLARWHPVYEKEDL